LGGEQKRWLDAYRKIAEAKKTYSEYGGKEVAAEYEIAKREDALKLDLQRKSTESLKNIEKSLAENLEYAE
jgi:hypothetical protein